MQRKSKPRDVVAFDLHRFDDDYNSYKFLRAKDKFAHLLKHRHTTCEFLQKNEPDSAWVIAWREYGITERGDHERSVSREFKQYFKNELQKVTTEYPNLTIVAGTLSIKKEISPDRLERIANYYAEHGDLVKVEMSDSRYAQSMQYKSHLDQHASVMEEMDKLVDDNNPVISVRNTCFIIHGDDERAVMRHSKVAPFNELSWNNFPNLKNVVFQPGHGRSRPHTFPLMSEVGRNVGGCPTMIVEVCREHDLGAAHLQREELGYDNPASLHFVLSDSIIPSKDQMAAGYFIHLDSTIRPKLIRTSLHREDMPNVKMYYCNALRNKLMLSDVIEPYTLFEDKILHELRHMRGVAVGESKQTLLANIEKEFLFRIRSIDSRPLYIFLENYFTHHAVKERLLRPDKDASGSAIFGIFKTIPERVQLSKSIEKILYLVEEQKDLHPHQKDYMSRRPPNEL